MRVLRAGLIVVLGFAAAMNLFCRAAEPTPKRGGILRVPLGNDLSSLDPALCYNFPGMFFVRVIYQSLVNYDDEAGIVPELARSWSVSSNGLQYTFELDARARFSNGRPVAASDYVFAFERTLSPKMHCPGDFLYLGISGVTEFRSGKATNISGIKAVANDRLAITLDQPDLTFLFRLAMPFVAPVSAEELKETYRDLGAARAGAGPFMLERWVRGASIRFVRNPHYGGSAPAWIDEIRALVGVNDSVAQMMFERGELDLADVNAGVAGAEFSRILRTPHLRENLIAEPSSVISYIALNTEIPPFDNKLVRKAMNFAVNKKRLMQIQNERAEEIPGVLPPVMPGFRRDLKGYDYSPETARRLLTEAGFPNGFTSSIYFNNSVLENFRFVAAIQEDLRQAGIIMEAIPLSFPAYLDKCQRRRAVPASLAAWSQDYPDPSNYLDSMLFGETISERECQNMSFYNNPEVNALIKKAAASLDMNERIALYQKAEEIVVDDAPWIFLQARKQYCLHQPWVKNARPHAVWAFRFEKMWMNR